MSGSRSTQLRFWAKFTSGNADRVVKRNLSQAQLDRLRENVAQHVEWGVEPMPER